MCVLHEDTCSRPSSAHPGMADINAAVMPQSNSDSGAPAPYVTLFLVRHGETHLNASHVLQGSGVDPPLNATGNEQARLVGERFSREQVDGVASSWLLRARETAQYIHKYHPHTPFQVIPDLAEIHWGKFDGVAIPTDVAKLVDAWKDGNFDARLPDGESAAEAEARAVSALGRYLDEQGGGNRHLVIVLHGRLLRILLSSLLDGVLDRMPIYEHRNTCVNELRVYRRNIGPEETTDAAVLAPWARDAGRQPSKVRRALGRYHFEAVRLNDAHHLAKLDASQAVAPTSLPTPLTASQ
ncbi:histidine phosphatase superfamily [Thamnocephalis sphaerospora]|uniref:Histidine phosphatase superfamily n=1 Tax=Thamnocephalis sphaerospora TaxID=78915 RepID=A0A4V1IWW8_9FUNG|nr:histidine phosphatase superfamily [Thamnocephalis sphaerospora]|eukprot:RKP09009.1 histidine phosphatase superfamily [Thamnocephalis sphaerospora]